MMAPLPPDPIEHPPWFAQVQAALAPWRGRGVVVAVSGGGDSVGLLRALVAVGPSLDLRLSVASFDHATRDGESARDAAFVAELATSLDLPFDLGHWPAERRTGHFEADARRARYAWLLTVAQDRAAAAVAVGHTSDDQAETILHRIVRGTGLHGLAGMKARRPLGPGVALIRPILEVTRAEVRTWLAATGQPWCDDPTNLDQARTRARIRHDLLPRLADDYNPTVTSALIRLGALAGAAARQADQVAARRLDRVVVERTDAAITFRRDRLRAIPSSGRADLLRLAWRQLGWPEGKMTHARWDRLTALAGGLLTGTTTIQAGINAVATPDHFVLKCEQAPPPPDSVPLEPRPLAIPGFVPWCGGRIIASLAPFDLTAPRAERIDRAAIEGPLIVRSAQAGDRFAPLGLNGHSQPLADFFRAQRIPRPDRRRVPILADARGILWVAPHRIAHRARQTPATVETVRLRYESNPEWP